MATAAIVARAHEVDGLLCLARRSLHDLFEPVPQFIVPSFFETVPCYAVSVMLRRDGRLRGSMTSRNTNPAVAVVEATQAAAADTRYVPITRAELEQIVIELWIQTSRFQISPHSDFLLSEFRLGVDGIELSIGERHALYKPSVPITAPLPSVHALLARLSGKLGLDEKAWTREDAVIHCSTWIHTVDSAATPNRYRRLERLRPIDSFAEITPDRVASCAGGCARHMLHIQRADGSIGYQYNPLRDEWSSEQSQVRFAGSAYALARAASHPQLSRVPGLHRGARALVAYLQANTISTDAGLFLPEYGQERAWGKLGASALLLLALEYAGSEQGLASMAEQLCQSLLRRQRADGSFHCRFQDDTEKDSEQDYFPGETLLALARYALNHPRAENLRAIGNAFPFYRQWFRAKPSTAFVPWQVEAWTLVCRHLSMEGRSQTPIFEEISQFVFEQIDWLLPGQYGSDETRLDYLQGGFGRPHMPSIASASYLEAIVHALDLADWLGETQRVRRYRDAARACMRFVLGLQVPPECSFLFPFPKHIVGAAVGSPVTFLFRCDYDQHFLTSLLTALDSAALWRDD